MTDPVVLAGDCADDGTLHLDLPRKAVQALCAARFKGQRVDVEIRARKSQRSARQNAAFHAALTPWAKELGYHVEELKDELLGLVWGYEERVSKLTGEVQRVLVKPHTSKLTTAEFSELMEHTVMQAAQTGYVMLLPDEFKQARQNGKAE